MMDAIRDGMRRTGRWMAGLVLVMRQHQEAVLATVMIQDKRRARACCARRNRTFRYIADQTAGGRGCRCGIECQRKKWRLL